MSADLLQTDILHVESLAAAAAAAAAAATAATTTFPLSFFLPLVLLTLEEFSVVD